jgi:hypothetical protein
VGPDVHKKTIAVATVEARASADVRFYGTIPDTPDAIRSMLRKLAKGGQRLHLGNFSRFASPRQLMASLGLNPSEHSSDATIRRGAITKTGNSLARTCLVEAAWTYRHPARVTQIIRERLQGLPEPIRAIAWKAPVRLSSRYRKLVAAGKSAPKAIVAVARALVGFIWAIARLVEPKAATIAVPKARARADSRPLTRGRGLKRRGGGIDPRQRGGARSRTIVSLHGAIVTCKTLWR